jgi:hypothetical protein
LARLRAHYYSLHRRKSAKNPCLGRKICESVSASFICM